MAKAEKLAKANPSKTVEQHFETVFTDPRYVELAKAAKRPATAMRQQEGKTNVDPQDEDDANDADVDPFDVEDDEADDVIGPGDDEDACSPNVGRTDAPWLGGGDGNARHAPKPAVVGAPEGSYNPRARPASATRKAFDAAVEKRVLKYMARNPSASRVQATVWATRGRKVQRLVNAS